jgi:hypothetical protein
MAGSFGGSVVGSCTVSSWSSPGGPRGLWSLDVIGEFDQLI